MLSDPVADWRKLSALYEQAESLESRELQLWLDGLAADSKRLLPALKRMIDARTRAAKEGFLETLPTLSVSGEPRVAEFAEGTRVGAYRLVQHIGSGGMAEVWLADRVDGAFERKVAIKLLFSHPTRAQRETFIARFRRERDILASLHHPNIAALHDAGITPDGQPWLALEYVEGLSITSWSDARALGINERLCLFMQVLLAVNSAHAQLVIHRDIKPSNVLVADDGRVKLLDFGIAKLLDPDGAVADTYLTRESGRPLTLQYASPEQYSGLPLTTASDQYSLGVLLYELLTGCRPYELASKSAAEMERLILDLEPKAPSQCHFSEETLAKRSAPESAVRRMLAQDLDAVVLKSVAKRPDERYSSIDAMRRDLERWQLGEPVMAKPDSAAYRLRKFLGRHRLAVTVGAATVTALLLATSAALLMAHRAVEQAERAAAARDFMIRTFKVADPDKLEGPEPSAREVLATASDRAVIELRSQPELLASVLSSIGKMQTNLELLTAADKTYTRLAALEREQGQREQWSRAQLLLAANAQRSGAYARARELLNEIDGKQAALPDDPAFLSELHRVRGWTLRGLRELGDAEREFGRALDAAVKAYGAQDVRTLAAVHGLADVAIEFRRFDAALETIDAAERRMTWTAQNEDARLGLGIVRVNVLVRAGRYERTLAALRPLSKECERISGRDHYDCLLLLNMHATVLLRLADCPGLSDIASGLERASSNALSPRLHAHSLARLGHTIALCGPIVAQGDLEARLATVASEPARNGFERVVARLALAELALARGALEEARRWVKGNHADLNDPTLPPVHRGRCRLIAAVLSESDGKLADAAALVADAEGDFIRELGHDHPLLAYFSLNRSRLLHRQGDVGEAVAIGRLALAQLRPVFGESAPVLQKLELELLSWTEPKRAVHFYRSPHPFL